MNKINLITPPDKLHNDAFSLLLIQPTEFTKSQIQAIVQEIDIAINIYLYETSDVDWLLDVTALADCVIVDIDNCNSATRDLCSYLIAKPKTYWLTQGENTVYNKLSANRIYDLDFIRRILEQEI
jgi:hypothetical protein